MIDSFRGDMENIEKIESLWRIISTGTHWQRWGSEMVTSADHIADVHMLMNWNRSIKAMQMYAGR